MASHSRRSSTLVGLVPVLAACALSACGAPPDAEDSAAGAERASAAVVGYTPPAGWTLTQIGTVSVTPGVEYDPATGVLNPIGAGVFPTSHVFVQRSFTGDAELVVAVYSLVASSTARSGIAAKAQLNNASSMMALTIDTHQHAYLTTKIGSAAAQETALPQMPSHLRIRRRGNVFSAYVKEWSGPWIEVGEATLTGVGAAAFYGPLTASGTTNTPSAAQVYRINVSKLNPFTNQNVGGATPAASLSFDAPNDLWTQQGGGKGVSGTSDALAFASRPIAGDGTFTAYVQPPNGAVDTVRGGVMLRASATGNNVQTMFLSISNSDELRATWRTATGATASEVLYSGSFGSWLRIVRTGTTVQALTSWNGYDFQLVQQVTMPGLPSTVYVGLATTSGQQGATAIMTGNEEILLPTVPQP